MISDWRTMPLSEIADFSQGLQVPMEEQFPDPCEGYCRFIRIIDFTDPLEPPRYIKRPSEKYWAAKDDIVMIRYGSQTAGRVVKGLEGVIANNMFKVNVLNDEVNKDYLFYFLLSEKVFKYLRDAQSSSTMPAITFGMLKKIQVPLPSLKEQSEIASALKALEDSIGLLRETNATLEAIAQALFKSWFVDFDPVRAKQEGREPEGMDAETAELFPDCFGDSGLGRVPKGWRVNCLGDEVVIAYGKNLPTSNLQPDGYPVFGGNGQIGFFDRYIYKERQVLIACRGAASGKVNQSLPKSFVTNNSLVLETDKGSTLPFCYLKQFMLHSDLTPFVTGSAQPQVTIDNLRHFKVLVPHPSILAKYRSVVDVIEDYIEKNQEHVLTLEQVRDTLLPRLISGQLRLPEASELIKAAA